MSNLSIALVCWFVCSLVLALPTGMLNRDRSRAPGTESPDRLHVPSAARRGEPTDRGEPA